LLAFEAVSTTTSVILSVIDGRATEKVRELDDWLVSLMSCAARRLLSTSVHLSVCLSVLHDSVLYQNGLSYRWNSLTTW